MVGHPVTAKLNHLRVSQSEVAPKIRAEMSARNLNWTDVARMMGKDYENAGRVVRDYVMMGTKAKIGFHAQFVEWLNGLPPLDTSPPPGLQVADGVSGAQVDRVVRKALKAALLKAAKAIEED